MRLLFRAGATVVLIGAMPEGAKTDDPDVLVGTARVSRDVKEPTDANASGVEVPVEVSNKALINVRFEQLAPIWRPHVL